MFIANSPLSQRSTSSLFSARRFSSLAVKASHDRHLVDRASSGLSYPRVVSSARSGLSNSLETTRPSTSAGAAASSSFASPRGRVEEVSDVGSENSGVRGGASPRIRVCTGKQCRKGGAAEILSLLRKGAGLGIDGLGFELSDCGCRDLCKKGPIAILRSSGGQRETHLYVKPSPAAAALLLQRLQEMEDPGRFEIRK